MQKKKDVHYVKINMTGSVQLVQLKVVINVPMGTKFSKTFGVVKLGAKNVKMIYVNPVT